MLSAGPSAGRRRLVVLVAAAVAAALTARLGWWQLDRAGQKLALQARIESRAALPPLPLAQWPATSEEAAAQHYRPVVLQGRWLEAHTRYLDNRQMNARQGFYVVTPLQLDDGGAVLVQRGWMPRDFSDRTRLQPLPPQAGRVQVSGRLAPPPARLLALSDAEQGPIRQNVDLLSMARETGLALRPWSVQQTAPTQAVAATDGAAVPGDNLLRQWPAVAVDVGKHHGYAFQWFSLSALLVGLTAWFQFIRPRWRGKPPVDDAPPSSSA